MLQALALPPVLIERLSQLVSNWEYTDPGDSLLAHLTPFGVRSLISQPPTLEDLFLRHYETEERDAQPIDRAGVAR